MAVELKVPPVGESITEVQIGEWLKPEGGSVRRDEAVVVIETEKATVELPSPAAGRITRVLKPRGARAQVGEVIGYLEEGAAEAAPAAPASPAPAKAQPAPPAADTRRRATPAAQKVLEEHGLKVEQMPPPRDGERVSKEDVLQHLDRQRAVSAPAPSAPPAEPGFRSEEVVPMSMLRRKVAERLVAAQHNAALLTTFNEIDMSAVMALRQRHQEPFQKRYGIKLGFMSFFVKAAVDALRAVPQLNAEIRGDDIAYRNYYDIGVAVGGGKGLVVPVIRDAEALGFAEVELAIADFAKRAQENKLKLEELQGGTFSITNGGIYGSLMSTPIVNPPQSGILGMHAVQERPVAREGQVVIRPMMYVALTYDHRVVDGREAVTFLKRIKDAVEDPARILLEV